MSTNEKEQKFYNALQDIFIGAKIEGQGGFVNLMRIKSNYYQKIEKFLKDDIEQALAKYPSFREELFDKLYNFFTRYFTESGSIYFNSTPFHNNVYERVYTDDRDVILFWKTQMLYYVKTDRIFKSMPVEFDNYKFYFDASTIENKKANEKRSLIYELKEVKEDKTIVFNVYYSEKGRVTKTEDILKELKKKNIKLDEEQLERAFRIFEKQSEVDFFINKNAKAFLQEQFKLWSYQYFWEGAKEWTADRINELQILKDIAFKIIDFISQFEDELEKIWNKPKFVKNANYVITLDRLNDNIIEKIIYHKNLDEQIEEWKQIGIVDEDFEIEHIFENFNNRSNEYVLDLFSSNEELQKEGLISTGYHLPYNPELVERAKELRKNMTPAEKKLWYEYLRNFKHRVLRQRPINHFIVDFYCPALKLVIEIDGKHHFTEEGKSYDEERRKILERYGLREIRFRNDEVINEFDRVCKEIEGIPPVSPLNKGGYPPMSPLNKEGSHPVSPLSKGGIKGGIKKQFLHLPIDTKYFKDLEPEILSQFDDLDNSLDGWLIKSENYQALNTILPKFKEKVQTIYIDPPYNTGSDGFIYKDRYQHSSWLTMMENRLSLTRELMKDDGVIFVSIDDNEVYGLKIIGNYIFPYFISNLIWQTKKGGGQAEKLYLGHEYILVFSKHNNVSLTMLNVNYEKHLKNISGEKTKNCIFKDGKWYFINDDIIRKVHGKYKKGEERRLEYEDIEKYKGRDKKKEVDEKLKSGEYILVPSKNPGKHYVAELKPIDYRQNIYSIIQGYLSEKAKEDYYNLFGIEPSQEEYYKPMDLVKFLVDATNYKNSVILDFFAGSGTTAHAVMKLNKEDGGKRKFILVEMGDYFDTIIIPRIKKVAYSFNWKDGKPQDADGIGGFFKYYELEQYEETLANTVYENHDMYIAGNKSVYEQYVFLKDEKMLRALEVDYENKKVNVDLSKIYPPVSPLNKGGIQGGIDIAETISNLTGKWIKRITLLAPLQEGNYEVEFEDGTKINTKDLDYKLIKPLIWWE